MVIKTETNQFDLVQLTLCVQGQMTTHPPKVQFVQRANSFENLRGKLSFNLVLYILFVLLL